LILKRSKASLLAWTLFAIITAIALFSMVDTLANRPAGDNLLNVVNLLLESLLGVEFAFLAALIVSRQPRNAIGWLMMLPTLAWIFDFIIRRYLEQFPTAPVTPSAPLLLALWFDNAGWLLLIFPLIFTMLLFPDGRPPSPRWRWVLITGLGLCSFFIFIVVFSSTTNLIENVDWQVANPIGFLPAAGIQNVVAFWGVGLAALTLLCAAAPFVRYHQASGVQRQQIKWLFYACGLFALIYIPGVIFGVTESLLADSWGLLFTLALMAIPAAIAVAILRYRLYDIDVIIRKTLVYGALTGLLALVYFGSVVLLQGLFEAITGQSSPIIIVLSTLLIAALFTPLRRRVQRAIDRRFFRQKYDAQQVLAQFAETARDEVELETLTAELLRVTRETVQPETVTIWLREHHT
jgi:hypothetical protein